MYKDLIDQWKSYDDNDIIMVNHLLVPFNKMAKGIRKIQIINKRINKEFKDNINEIKKLNSPKK